MNGFLQPAVAFLATIFLIVLLRPLAFRLGLTDRPGERKVHKDDMPLVGGIAIYLAIGLAAVSAYLAGVENVFDRPFLSFFAGATLLVIVGAWDDWRELSPLVRIIGQTCAGLIMVYGANIILVDVGDLGLDGSALQLGMLAVPFTVFVTVGMINAINMCDGLDGLSGNMSLVLLAGLGVANSFWGDNTHLEMLNVVSAAIAGFLVFNQRSFWRNKAWVFLGDAGSMMLGFALAWNAIEITLGYPRVVSPPVVLWFLAIPVFDTVTLMLRRIFRGKSPFEADSEHLHHLFVRIGFSVGETIGIICVLAGTGCVIGLLFAWLQVPDLVVAVAFVLAGLGYLVCIQSAWNKGSFIGRVINAI